MSDFLYTHPYVTKLWERTTQSAFSCAVSTHSALYFAVGLNIDCTQCRDSLLLYSCTRGSHPVQERVVLRKPLVWSVALSGLSENI